MKGGGVHWWIDRIYRVVKKNNSVKCWRWGGFHWQRCPRTSRCPQSCEDALVSSGVLKVIFDTCHREAGYPEDIWVFAVLWGYFQCLSQAGFPYAPARHQPSKGAFRFTRVSQGCFEGGVFFDMTSWLQWGSDNNRVSTVIKIVRHADLASFYEG